MNKLVSIILPTYNREDRLLSCVNAIFKQDYRPLELIIVNDGNKLSQLKSEIKLLKNESFKIQILENPINFGPCITRNIGLNHASGDFVTLCDDDDLFINNRISTLMETLSKSNFLGVFSDSINDFGSYERTTKLPDIVNLNKILYGNYVGAQFLTSKALLDDIRFDRKFLASQDHDFITSFIIKHGAIEKCKIPTYISNQYESETRVSNNVFLGRIQYYNKHKSKMQIKHKVVFIVKLIAKILKIA